MIPKSVKGQSTKQAEQAQKAWAEISEDIEAFTSISGAADGQFETICRKIWKFSQDENKMQTMGFQSFYDLFKDPEVMELIESPSVKFKIDLHKYQNQNRFYHLLWWDSEFPTLRLLMERHLTPMTQKPGAIGEMKELLRGDKSIDKAREILFNEGKPVSDAERKVDEEFTSRFCTIHVDGVPSVRFNRDTAEQDPHVIRFRSRMLHLPKDRWIINVPSAKLFLATEDGMLEVGQLMTNKPEVLEYLESKGFRIQVSE